MIRGVCRNHEGTKNTKTHEEFLYNKIFVDLRAFVSSWLRTRDSERAAWPNRAEVRVIRGACRNHENTKNMKTHEEFLYNKIFVDLRAFVSSWLRTRDSERAAWPNREARVIRGACRNHEGTKNTKTHEEFLYKKIFVDLRAFVSSWLRTRDSERAAWPRR